MTKTILDIDDYASWSDQFEAAVYDARVWPYFDADLDGDWVLYREFHNAPEYVVTPMIVQTFAKISEVVRATYTHVAAYHACRTRNRESYRQKGLLPSSRERLTEDGRMMFEGIRGLDAAIRQCDSYFGTYGRSVSLYMTARDAPADYLDAPHYLQMLARCLGAEGINRLDAALDDCQPMFVRCSIPVEWSENDEYVRGSLLHPYVGTIAKTLIWRRKRPSMAFEDNPCALVLLKDIPPENIEGFIDPRTLKAVGSQSK